MIKDFSRTFKQTAIYGISNVLIKVAGLILIPIYTSSLSLDDFGRLVILEIMAQFFVGSFSFQIPAALLRLGSDTEEKSKQGSYYFTALMMLIGAVGLFLLFFLPLRGIISETLFESADYKLHLTYLAVSISAEILGLLPFQLLRLQERAQTYLLFFALKLISLVSFVWYFVVYTQGNVLGAIEGIMIANLVFLASTLVLQLRNMNPRFNKAISRAMFNYGWPLVFTAVAGVLLTISDRLIIKIYGAFSEVGIYGLAHKIGSLANLLILSSFTLGFLPIAFKKLKDTDFPVFFGKTLTYYIGVTVLLTLGVSLFGKEIIKVISSGESDYWLAAILVPFIAYLFIFKALYNYFSYTFLLSKKTKSHAIITLTGVVCNVLLNFSLIPYFGMYGAIAATGLSYIIMMVLSYMLARRQMRIAYEFKRIALLLFSCAVFIAVGLTGNDLDIIWRLLFKTSLTLLFMAFLYFGVVTKGERIRIQKLATLLKSPGGIKKLIQEIGN